MRDERPRGGARFLRFIDNHDIANDAYDHRIEKAWGTRRVNATLVVLFTLDGVPMIYNGQEVADTARHSIFGRMPIDWSSGDTPAGQARLAFCKRLCTMRRTEPALTHGAVVWLDNDQPDAILSLLRRTSDEEVLSVVNLSEHKKEVRINVAELAAWSGDTLIADGAQVQSDNRGCRCNWTASATWWPSGNDFHASPDEATKEIRRKIKGVQSPASFERTSDIEMLPSFLCGVRS
jgi:cyclomaltodextrinase / maltogenic alpha-amylase / neopullulanase